jgi:hypothetical protein
MMIYFGCFIESATSLFCFIQKNNAAKGFLVSPFRRGLDQRSIYRR